MRKKYNTSRSCCHLLPATTLKVQLQSLQLIMLSGRSKKLIHSIGDIQHQLVQCNAMQLRLILPSDTYCVTSG